MTPLRFLAAAVLAGVLGGSPAAAQTPPEEPGRALTHLSLEELARIDVTSVSKHAEPIEEAAKAIVVITADDLRRSGVTSLPEALRLATGVAVARFDGHTWGITTRGFNASTANKLQVMIDGRSIYTPLFSGVYWDMQGAILEDIDRIEVIRGPGASLWGANAVNGVINIITKRAQNTTRTLVQIGGGSELGEAAVRVGGTWGDASAYRVYGKASYRRALEFSTGDDAHDPLREGRAGFRVDWQRSTATAITIQGEAQVGRAGLSDRPDIEMSSGNVLARVSHTTPSGAQFQLQAYYDGSYRKVPRQFSEHRDTVDVDAQYRTSLGSRHDLTVGAGYDVTSGRAPRSLVLFFEPETRTSPLLNVFVQDDITLVPKYLSLMAGTKVEHNDYTGVEYQPTARLRITPGHRQTIWAAVSRAVRMPTRFDTDLRFTGLFPVVVLQGNPAFQSERVIASEAGYRRLVSDRWSFDVTTFYNAYDRLRTQEPTLPAGVPITLANNLQATTAGVEVNADVRPAGAVRVHAGYSWLWERFAFLPVSRDTTNATTEANDPAHQLWLRTSVDLPHAAEFDAMFRFVGALPSPVVPAYAELNLRLGWRPASALEISIVGNDLLHARHPEFGGLVPREEYPRNVFLQTTWRF